VGWYLAGVHRHRRDTNQENKEIGNICIISIQKTKIKKNNFFRFNFQKKKNNSEAKKERNKQSQK
jgi:hypothetical protein